AVTRLSSHPGTIKVFGVIPSRASGRIINVTNCLTRRCMRLLTMPYCIILSTHSTSGGFIYRYALRNALTTQCAASVNAMTCQSQVIIHTPEPSAGRAPPSFYRRPHILGAAALKPRTTTSNRTQRMCITIAQFRPAVYLTIGAHSNAVRINAAEARVPRLNPVKPHIIRRRDAIKYLALAAMAEDAAQWMRDDGQAALLLYQAVAVFHTQSW